MEVSKLEINQEDLHRLRSLAKESECRASVQIMLCNSFIYTNNIQKHYLVSRGVISIIIVIAPTHFNIFRNNDFVHL